MKKLKLIIIALVITSFLNAQTVEKDKLSFNLSTAIYPDNNLIGTGIYFLKDDNNVNWNIGSEVTYFTENKLGVIFGIGYGQINKLGILSLKFGGKYYLLNRIPLTVDLTGSISGEYYNYRLPIYTSLQAGYAFFINDCISIEPSVRYNVSLLNKENFDNYLQMQIGFSIFI